MAVHWTCAIPRQNPDVEQSNLLSQREWGKLYDRAEKLLKLDKNGDVFKDSIRNMLVMHEIKTRFPQRHVRELPLAVQKNEGDNTQVIWSGSDTVLGEKLVRIAEENQIQGQQNESFRILVRVHLVS